VYFDWFMFIIYTYVSRYRDIFCFAITCVHVFVCIWIEQGWWSYTRIRWMEEMRIKTMLKNAHIGRGGTHRSDDFLCEHGMCVFIGNIDTYEY